MTTTRVSVHARKHCTRFCACCEQTCEGCTHLIDCTVWFTLSASATATATSDPMLDFLKLDEHERWCSDNMQPRSALKHSTCRLTRCRGSSHDVRCHVVEQGQMEWMTTSCVNWHSSSCVVMTVRNRDVLQSHSLARILPLQKFDKLRHLCGRFSW